MSPEENTLSNEARVPKARILRQEYKDIQGKEAGLSVLSRLCLVAGIVGVLACVIAGLACADRIFDLDKPPESIR